MDRVAVSTRRGVSLITESNDLHKPAHFLGQKKKNCPFVSINGLETNEEKTQNDVFPLHKAVNKVAFPAGLWPDFQEGGNERLQETRQAPAPVSGETAPSRRAQTRVSGRRQFAKKQLTCSCSGPLSEEEVASSRVVEQL